MIGKEINYTQTRNRIMKGYPYLTESIDEAPKIVKANFILHYKTKLLESSLSSANSSQNQTNNKGIENIII